MKVMGEDPLRILQIEDNPLDIELTRSHLQRLGVKCHVTAIQTEDELNEILQSRNADLILSDSNLPAFDIDRALERARSNNIPFVLYSGHGPAHSQALMLKYSATAVISKDSPDELLRFIEEFAQRKQHRNAQTRLPRIGADVIVQCRGFRCLGRRNSVGEWVDANGNPLPEVLEWFEP